VEANLGEAGKKEKWLIVEKVLSSSSTTSIGSVAVVTAFTLVLLAVLLVLLAARHVVTSMARQLAGFRRAPLTARTQHRYQRKRHRPLPSSRRQPNRDSKISQGLRAPHGALSLSQSISLADQSEAWVAI